jgi:hypothetical protein
MADKKLPYVVDATVLQGIPLPQQTRTYKPVTHSQLIDLSLEGITKAGFTIEKEIYSMARGGDQANARYHLKHGSDPELGLMIGWQNSYDKSMSLKFAIGAHVFICSNGCVHGDIGAFKKKHMGDVQDFTPTKIAEYIGLAELSYDKIVSDKNRLKEIELTKKTKAELVGRMYIDDAIITSTQLGIIKKEIEAPTHDYNAKDSAWELYNYTTFALKEDHPHNWFNRHINVHKFFTEAI